MNFARSLVLVIALLEGSWTTFDGGHALATGDYLTPKADLYAGQLGMWHRVVSAVGIAPRSTAMKLKFVGYGVSWLVIAFAFWRRAPWGWSGMMVGAVAALWYLPVGTACSLVQTAAPLWLRRSI